MAISTLFWKRAILTCSTAAAVMLAVTAGATGPKSQLRIRAAEVDCDAGIITLHGDLARRSIRDSFR